MEHLRRYRFLWRTFRPLVAAWMKRKFRYDPEICTEAGPFLVLCNHNTDWDPLLLGSAFPEYMSFVASEHIYRWGTAAKLIVSQPCTSVNRLPSFIRYESMIRFVTPGRPMDVLRRYQCEAWKTLRVDE